jgi:peroxiredoxin
VKLSDYRGKVLLNFWATSCGGCKVEIAWFQEFETALGPRDFAVLGISMDEEGWGAVKPYIEEARVTYRMALADKSIAEDYVVTSMPATFIIDRKERSAATYIGLVDRSH